MLVGAASSAGARVRPTPQETVATLKFSTKKLVVARPRLKKVRFPFPGGDFKIFRESPKLISENSRVTFEFSRALLDCFGTEAGVNFCLQIRGTDEDIAIRASAI